MDFIWIILGFIVSIIFLVVFSFLSGKFFRDWNEGSENVKNDKKSNIKTFIIGLIIMLIVMLLYSKCD